MKSVKRFARMTALAVAVCMLLALGVFAAETGHVWVTASSAEGGTVAAVMGDGIVTDGVVAMTYDADALTYQGIEVNETYVAMYSVNAEEAGVVRISWVAPGEIDIDGEDWLFKISLTGTTEEDMTLSGTVTGAEIIGAPEKGEDPTDPAQGGDEGEDEGSEDATRPTVNGGSTGGNGAAGTGDNSNMMVLIAIVVACAAGIAALAIVMAKGKKEGKA